MKLAKAYLEKVFGVTSNTIRINFEVIRITSESVKVNIIGIDAESKEPILSISELVIPSGGSITLDMDIPLQINLS